MKKSPSLLTRRKLFSTLAGIGAVFGLGVIPKPKRVKPTLAELLTDLKARSVDPPRLYAGGLTLVDSDTMESLGQILEPLDPYEVPFG